MTNTDKIFQVSAPYANPYQGPRSRLLFVCSAGLLRSPTGAHVGDLRGYNTRSCGSWVERALIPMSVNLIEWAEFIIFVQDENYKEALKTFEPVGYTEDIMSKAIILDIPDNHDAFEPRLIRKFNEWFDVWENSDVSGSNSGT